uniref:Uncharacterized protein n=1 Tax=Pseudomonas phage Cygsa01 TaxID=3138529 RepID=A0AAU6W4V1_9VIRU
MAYLNHDKLTRREAVLMARTQHRRLMKRILDKDQSATADLNRYNRNYWLKIAAFLKGV